MLSLARLPPIVIPSEVEGSIKHSPAKRLNYDRAVLEESIAELQQAGESAWEDLKQGLENSWEILKTSLSKAKSEFERGYREGRDED